jgi:hypothetical protein
MPLFSLFLLLLTSCFGLKRPHAREATSYAREVNNTDRKKNLYHTTGLWTETTRKHPSHYSYHICGCSWGTTVKSPGHDTIRGVYNCQVHEGVSTKNTDVRFWRSKAGKGVREIYGCWYMNFKEPDKCLLTQQLSALTANPTPTSKKATAAWSLCNATLGCSRRERMRATSWSLKTGITWTKPKQTSTFP